ncbi:hypothetical protein OKC48_16425 [Methylorubrum extorquens]|uniref:hypothetical protein n=1 Tax=Methylorubrum extorquens TaxID=408 RepID=UPI0022383851|nr:hypothetical protein [Methylorubrum extorquens]UYW24859.1 hypothetical protein OKC48_16425 [Methylorubrum extorquens]
MPDSPPDHTMEPNGEEGFVVKVGGEVAGYVTPDVDSPGLWVTEDQDRRLMGRVYDPEKGAEFLAASFVSGDDA